ncbi:hypothetical protein [Sphingobium sp. Cam5-1]|uniref:hypothetical protein n=1 Tax=Sphingobium sp. Cam5-1 TaxID=2789327 RepID=UPI0018AD19C2|nr:hypothetical protein [Sphingobium sp. Cam5-1]QPI72813.1 hypothetical protein IZV00_13365 [Sphingobium sp. Cam5-1]
MKPFTFSVTLPQAFPRSSRPEKDDLSNSKSPDGQQPIWSRKSTGNVQLYVAWHVTDQKDRIFPGGSPLGRRAYSEAR